MTTENIEKNKNIASFRQKCEIYSRVCGYMRPVNAWNDAKREEFEDRVTFLQEDEKR